MFHTKTITLAIVSSYGLMRPHHFQRPSGPRARMVARSDQDRCGHPAQGYRQPGARPQSPSHCICGQGRANKKPARYTARAATARPPWPRSPATMVITAGGSTPGTFCASDCPCNGHDKYGAVQGKPEAPELTRSAVRAVVRLVPVQMWQALTCHAQLRHTTDEPARAATVQRTAETSFNGQMGFQTARTWSRCGSTQMRPLTPPPRQPPGHTRTRARRIIPCRDRCHPQRCTALAQCSSRPPLLQRSATPACTRRRQSPLQVRLVAQAPARHLEQRLHSM